MWLGAVVLGLIMRVMFYGEEAALPFVLVTIGVLGLGLLGWRAVAALITRLRGSFR